MSFLQTIAASAKGMFPGIVYWLVLPLAPFIIAEQLWPVHKAPRLRDYWMNILISLSTPYLSLPLGIAAGLWSSRLRHLLPWNPWSFSFRNIAAVPFIGSGLEVLAMICIPLLFTTAGSTGRTESSTRYQCYGNFTESITVTN